MSPSTCNAASSRPTRQRAAPSETIPFTTFTDYQDDVWARVEAVGTGPIAKANLVRSKAERNAALDAAGEEIRAALGDEFADRPGEVKAAIRSLTKKLVRKSIVEEGVRVDGRGTADIRPLSAEIDLLPTAHGSALFQRGETQVLNVTTLGMPRMQPAARHDHPGRAQALHAPLQLPALLHR